MAVVNSGAALQADPFNIDAPVQGDRPGRTRPRFRRERYGRDVTITFAGSSHVIAAPVGYSVYPYAVTDVTASTATATSTSSKAHKTLPFLTPDALAPAHTLLGHSFVITFNGGSAFSYNGGAAASSATVNANGAAQVMLGQITGLSPGTHIMTITNGSTGATTEIQCVEAWDSTIPSILIRGAGRSGYTTANLAGNYGTQIWADPIQPVAPVDLHILKAGVNDYSSAVSAAASQANIETLWGQMTVYGSDQVFVSMSPRLIADQPLASQATYRDAMKNVAVAHNAIFADSYQRYADFGGSDALLGPLRGCFYASDGLHQNALGLLDEARFIADVIAPSGVLGP
jgi:hypothetical protein